MAVAGGERVHDGCRVIGGTVALGAEGLRGGDVGGGGGGGCEGGGGEEEGDDGDAERGAHIRIRDERIDDRLCFF